MKVKRYIIFVALSLVFLATFSLRLAQAAEEYPTRPVEIVCPVPAGGSTDLTMRVVVAVAKEYLGQPLIPVIHTGAGGARGIRLVANSKPDGYTILMGPAGSLLFRSLIEEKPPYTLEDFIALGRISASPWIFSVLSTSPWKSLRDFLDDAKKNPKKFKYSSGGALEQEHLFFTQLSQETGIELIHVPAGGGGPALTMLLGGHVDTSIFLPAVISPHIAAGTIRPLAVLSDERYGLAGLKDVPTLRELGFNISTFMFNGIFAPKGTPQPIVQKLRTVVKQICEDPSLKSLMARMNEEIKYMSGEDFEKWLKEESVKIDKLIKSIKQQR